MGSIFRDIKLYYEPRRECLNMYEWPGSEPEMTEFESAFLCGMIRERKPTKIVEVGVAGGATTAIILKCIEDLGLTSDTEVFSVDILEQFYRGNGERTGYLADHIIESGEGKFRHSFFLGKPLPEVIDIIGDSIDFVILDTVHALPGEMLDFLTIFPYLRNGACIVLHDIANNHYGRHSNAFATQILLNSVIAERYVMKDQSRLYKYPNIGAFVLTDNTEMSIPSIFGNLLVSWSYKLPDDMYQVYYNHFTGLYGEEYAEFFRMTYCLQEEMVVKLKKERQVIIDKVKKSKTYRIGEILLWVPRKMKQVLCHNHCL